MVDALSSKCWSLPTVGCAPTTGWVIYPLNVGQWTSFFVVKIAVKIAFMFAASLPCQEFTILFWSSNVTVLISALCKQEWILTYFLRFLSYRLSGMFWSWSCFLWFWWVSQNHWSNNPFFISIKVWEFFYGFPHTGRVHRRVKCDQATVPHMRSFSDFMVPSSGTWKLMSWIITPRWTIPSAYCWFNHGVSAKSRPP
jgi:hypothetical protein